MRDVTLNQQEQARIQVLNGVLEYQLPIAQAAEIMGVSERHTKRLLVAYRKGGLPPHWPTGTGAVGPTMLSLRSLRLPW